jgi:predicted GNAT family acetyltransferase
MIDEPQTMRVEDDRAHDRYEAHIGHGLAGFASYELSPGRITFLHTRTEPAFAGRGVASGLARVALDDARARGLRVTPICPFFAAYIERHPAYADLVDPPS